VTILADPAAACQGRNKIDGALFRKDYAMLRFEGDRDFALAPEVLWEKLTDVHFLVDCIPDVETVKELGPDHAALVLRPSFAFVRGTLEVTIDLVDKAAPESARFLLHSKGIGSSSDVEATVHLARQGDGTRVHWVAEVKALGGLLKAVPAGLIRGAAQKVVNEAWAAIEKKLASGFA
jgi:carbon monoxide dehydrogenase subunit G